MFVAWIKEDQLEKYDLRRILQTVIILAVEAFMKVKKLFVDSTADDKFIYAFFHFSSSMFPHFGGSTSVLFSENVLRYPHMYVNETYTMSRDNVISPPIRRRLMFIVNVVDMSLSYSSELTTCGAGFH